MDSIPGLSNTELIYQEKNQSIPKNKSYSKIWVTPMTLLTSTISGMLFIQISLFTKSYEKALGRCVIKGLQKIKLYTPGEVTFSKKNLQPESATSSVKNSCSSLKKNKNISENFLFCNAMQKIANSYDKINKNPFPLNSINMLLEAYPKTTKTAYKEFQIKTPINKESCILFLSGFVFILSVFYILKKQK